MAIAVNGLPAENVRLRAAETLTRIVNSAEFRGSQRSVEFLRFVMACWEQGDVGRIREKTIAVEVFGKANTYDPAEDSFVRVKASDLRKRLAAYYEGSGVGDPVRIEIPLGSYQPVVSIVESASQATEREIPKWRTSPGYLLGGAAAILSLTALAFSGAWGGQSALEKLWTPMVEGQKPVVISLPVLTRFQVLGQHEKALREGTLGAGAQIPAERVRLKDEVVGMGAALGAAQLTGMLSGGKHEFEMRAGKDMRYSDLRAGPVVLLGGFSSAWTLEEMKSWRYRMLPGPPGQIVDTKNPGQLWQVEGFRIDGRAERDFALITKVTASSHGHPLLALSGITTFGTQAAAEFVVQESRLRELFGKAPAEWEGGSFQAVISVRVKEDTPGPARLEAAWFW